ncbi:MAG: hydantoinase B/oxoprolinase family protein [Proteobacteria bacterium]|nr:hydantoinase B/oxoprolinase family protein [Pseudomonadota bacterium]
MTTGPARPTQPNDADPVTIEIVHNGLTGVAEQITQRMIRSANSFIVKEMEDCSAALFDARGRLLAESATIPIHLNCVGICLRTVLDRYFPTQTWREGDIVITNDVYLAGTSMASAHTNDFIAFYPVFWQGDLVAFSGLMVHHLDIGAMNMATRGWGTEIYQEGFRVPPVKIAEEGVLDRKLLAVLLNNTRVPQVLENDLTSQLASVRAAGDDLGALFRKYGRETLDACFDALIAFSERRTREEIARIPDGTYSHVEPILDDGSKGGPYWLRLTIEKKGDEIAFDFTGTDAQVMGPVNCPLAATWAAVFYVLRCVTDPSIPSTEGCKRPVRVIAPEGTLVNAKAPAAVYQRMVVCHSIVDLVMGALASAVPERTMADSCGCAYNYTIGRDRETGRHVTWGEVAPGGIGATGRADGAEVMSCHVTNCPLPPIEALEIESPVMYLRREYREDTGGPGQWRGGVGQVLSYQVKAAQPALHHTSQKSVSLPQGMAGGQPGDGGRWVINEGRPDERVLDVAIGDVEPLNPGDTVTHYSASGGGFGDPRTRNPEKVLADVRAGLVTPESAERIYGVRVDRSRTHIEKILR